MPIGLVTCCDASILRVGIGGNNAKFGDRTPAIFLHKGLSMRIFSAVNDEHNFKFTTPDDIPMNEWTRVEISQLRQPDGVYQLTIRIGGIIVLQKTNTDPKEFSDVKVYTGDNFYKPADAKIANLMINTFPDTINIVPTLTSTTTITTTPPG